MVENRNGTMFEFAQALTGVLKTLEHPLTLENKLSNIKKQWLLQKHLLAFDVPAPTNYSEQCKKLQATYEELLGKNVPKQYRYLYSNRLPLIGSIPEEKEVSIYQGINNELRTIEWVKKNTGEKINFRLYDKVKKNESKFKISYMGFSKNLRWSQIVGIEQKEEMNSMIEFDVPIMRGKKPYLLEVKNAGSRIYGNWPNEVNQLFKYDKAVEDGVLDGATFEIGGRLSHRFLKWVLDKNDPLPNVEIIYKMRMLNGKPYRFILKPSPKSHLGFTNNEKDFQDSSDKLIIKGIVAALDSPGRQDLISILGKFDRFNNPQLISNLNLLTEYHHYMNWKIIEGFIRAALNQSKKKYYDNIQNK